MESPHRQLIVLVSGHAQALPCPLRSDLAACGGEGVKHLSMLPCPHLVNSIDGDWLPAKSVLRQDNVAAIARVIAVASKRPCGMKGADAHDTCRQFEGVFPESPNCFHSAACLSLEQVISRNCS